MRPTNIVDITTFNYSESITLRDAIQADLLSMRGKRPSLVVVQRWANPKRGIRPAGVTGPRLVLPTVMMDGKRLLMGEWASAFQAERLALAMEYTRRMSGF